MVMAGKAMAMDDARVGGITVAPAFYQVSSASCCRRDPLSRTRAPWQPGVICKVWELRLKVSWVL